MKEEMLDLGTNYYILKQGGKEAIFKRDGKQISDWHDWIVPWAGLLVGKSDYYIAGTRIEEGELVSYICAIFHKDGRRVSDWYYSIRGGLINGESDYYIATIEDDGHFLDCIYHKDGYRVSELYDDIIVLIQDSDSCYFAYREKVAYSEKGQFYITKIGSEKKRVGPFKDMRIDSETKTYEVETEDGKTQTITTKDLKQFFAEKYTER